VSSPDIRGRVNAAESVRLQLAAADPAVFIVDEAYRSHDNGPNRVLMWTLYYAAQLGYRFRNLLPQEGSYAQRTMAILRSIADAQRTLPVLQNPMMRAPSPDDVRAARRSRSRLYRRAADAHDLLRSIEHLEPEAVSTLLSGTLVAPMERWRQYELALGLGMADALASVTGDRPRLHYIGIGVPDALITLGPYMILWQRPGPLYEDFALEVWERRGVGILAAYGVGPGWDRPDIVVVDSRSSRTIAVGEAKYFKSANWRDAFRGAVTQIIDYARGYEQRQGDVEAILSHSVVALWDVDKPLSQADGQPFVATFSTLEPTLQAWATRLADDGVLSAPPLTGSGVLSSTGSGAGG
jgi:hypothetical protein